MFVVGSTQGIKSWETVIYWSFWWAPAWHTPVINYQNNVCHIHIFNVVFCNNFEKEKLALQKNKSYFFTIYKTSENNTIGRATFQENHTSHSITTLLIAKTNWRLPLFFDRRHAAQRASVGRSDRRWSWARRRRRRRTSINEECFIIVILAAASTDNWNEMVGGFSSISMDPTSSFGSDFFFEKQWIKKIKIILFLGKKDAEHFATFSEINFVLKLCSNCWYFCSQWVS